MFLYTMIYYKDSHQISSHVVHFGTHNKITHNHQDLDELLRKVLPKETDSSWKVGKKALSSFHYEEKIRKIADTLRDNIIYLTHHSVITKQSTQLGGILPIIHDAEELRLLEWLSSFAPSSSHNRACEARESHTSEWFLESDHFMRWKRVPNSFAWLHGKR